ncbi:hypothetical protein ACO0J9_13050 [Pseudomonas aeruginosa]|uniref:hypothetical protein n=1 Tax=Pseudomonas aeruginosa TaxID=287 RepID=UPI0021DB0D75|nr:hypothetical protein [Pseudomonas aeruginosa]MCU9268989.1 hypothetical protein [Pseudomonas aeruginosa]
MNIKVTLRAALAAVVMSIAPVPVTASGFPTVDIAAIAQSVTDYINQLQQYAEQMTQTVLNESQLAEAIKLYEQTMVEYDHMLRQMEGLKSRISNRQWQQIYAKYGSVINTYPGMKPDFDSARWMKINRELETLFPRAQRLSDIEDDLASIAYDSNSLQHITETARQSYAREQLAVGQSMFVQDMDDELEVQMGRYGEVSSKRASLGAEDHLATLQVMAEQNELVIEALQQQSAINNAQLQYSNQLESHYFSNQNVGRKATLNEIKARQSRPIVVNESPLVNY